MNLTKITFAAGIFLAASVVLSYVHPWGDPRSDALEAAPLLEGSNVSIEVRQVLESKCADCHSANTRWPFYTRLAPASWLVEGDVREGRSHLNLSKWTQYSTESQIDLLTKLASEARSGEMPLKQYLILHPGARLTPAEQQLLYDWAKAERKRLREQDTSPDR